MAKRTKAYVEIIRGVEGLCVVINDRRVAGPKPWGGGKVIARYETPAAFVREAMSKATRVQAERAREAWLAERAKTKGGGR